MKTSRCMAINEFKKEMLKYDEQFRRWCLRDITFYQSEFRGLIDFGMYSGIPTYTIHRLIKKELKKASAKIVEEYNQQRDNPYWDEFHSNVANYVPKPIIHFSPESDFRKYLDTVDYKVVDISTIKSRGYCFGLSVPEIEVIVEEHRTRI